MLEKLAEYRKALAAFLVPALTILGLSFSATSDGGPAITPAEWVAIAIAALGTSAIVGVVPNALTTGQKVKLALRTKRQVNADSQAALAKAGLPPLAD